MDTMSAFPRSLFSESEMEVTRWFAARLGAGEVPSVQQVKNHRKGVLAAAGVSPTLREGKLGHVYSMLDFSAILKHVRALFFARKRAFDSSLPRNLRILLFARTSKHSLRMPDVT